MSAINLLAERTGVARARLAAKHSKPAFCRFSAGSSTRRHSWPWRARAHSFVGPRGPRAWC